LRFVVTLLYQFTSCYTFPKCLLPWPSTFVMSPFEEPFSHCHATLTNLETCEGEFELLQDWHHAASLFAQCRITECADFLLDLRKKYPLNKDIQKLKAFNPQRSRELSHTVSNMWFNLGICYAFTGEWVEASYRFEEAVSANRKSVLARYALAISKYQIEDYGAAYKGFRWVEAYYASRKWNKIVDGYYAFKIVDLSGHGRETFAQRSVSREGGDDFEEFELGSWLLMYRHVVGNSKLAKTKYEFPNVELACGVSDIPGGMFLGPPCTVLIKHPHNPYFILPTAWKQPKPSESNLSTEINPHFRHKVRLRRLKYDEEWQLVNRRLQDSDFQNRCLEAIAAAGSADTDAEMALTYLDAVAEEIKSLKRQIHLDAQAGEDEVLKKQKRATWEIQNGHQVYWEGVSDMYLQPPVLAEQSSAYLIVSETDVAGVPSASHKEECPNRASTLLARHADHPKPNQCRNNGCRVTELTSSILSKLASCLSCQYCHGVREQDQLPIDSPRDGIYEPQASTQEKTGRLRMGSEAFRAQLRSDHHAGPVVPNQRSSFEERVFSRTLTDEHQFLAKVHEDGAMVKYSREGEIETVYIKNMDDYSLNEIYPRPDWTEGPQSSDDALLPPARIQLPWHSQMEDEYAEVQMQPSPARRHRLSFCNGVVPPQVAVLHAHDDTPNSPKERLKLNHDIEDGKIDGHLLPNPPTHQVTRKDGLQREQLASEQARAYQSEILPFPMDDNPSVPVRQSSKHEDDVYCEYNSFLRNRGTHSMEACNNMYKTDRASTGSTQKAWDVYHRFHEPSERVEEPLTPCTSSLVRREGSRNKAQKMGSMLGGMLYRSLPPPKVLNWSPRKRPKEISRDLENATHNENDAFPSPEPSRSLDVNRLTQWPIADNYAPAPAVYSLGETKRKKGIFRVKKKECVWDPSRVTRELPDQTRNMAAIRGCKDG